LLSNSLSVAFKFAYKSFCSLNNLSLAVSARDSSSSETQYFFSYSFCNSEIFCDNFHSGNLSCLSSSHLCCQLTQSFFHSFHSILFIASVLFLFVSVLFLFVSVLFLFVLSGLFLFVLSGFELKFLANCPGFFHNVFLFFVSSAFVLCVSCVSVGL
jgi:hypothetical protein